jgi:hypothetical protein
MGSGQIDWQTHQKVEFVALPRFVTRRAARSRPAYCFGRASAERGPMVAARPFPPVAKILMRLSCDPSARFRFSRIQSGESRHSPRVSSKRFGRDVAAEVRIVEVNRLRRCIGG